MHNQEISQRELDAIRSLGDFDLTMIISEIHDNGWPVARNTLRATPGVSVFFDQSKDRKSKD